MLFLSSFTNRIDKKGRISVPATFRAVLANEGFNGLYASASMRLPSVECCGPTYFSKLHKMAEAMDPFSEARDAFAAAVFGEIQQLSFDGEGRVSLPASLVEHAGIKEEAVFVGKGETFEIWEPAAYGEYRAAARAQVQRSFYKQGGNA